MGFVSLALGPLGLIEALIILGLVSLRVRRFPERVGGYLVGVSIIPIVLLAAIVARMPSCDVGRSVRGECYAPITGPALIGYVVVGLAGAAIVGLTLRRWFAPAVPPG
jgi:Na+-translocating ferredoxin:NAD+ oxidoreductase RnfA subunit